MKGIKIMFLIMIVSLFIPIFWEKMPIIKNSVHFVLDPTAGLLLNWNKTIGMLFITIIIAILSMLAQKYLTDQEEMKKIKAEQKILQEEMKKYKDHPEKLMEFQKKQLEFIPRTMDITMRSTLYTFVPFILLLRWFMDYFQQGYKFFGFLSWIWFYIIFLIIFSIILKKVFKVH